MALLVVWALELRGKPCWLSVWDNAQISGLLLKDLWLLAIDCADAEVGVFLEDFLSVEVVEGIGGILTGNFSIESALESLHAKSIVRVGMRDIIVHAWLSD